MSFDQILRLLFIVSLAMLADRNSIVFPKVSFLLMMLGLRPCFLMEKSFYYRSYIQPCKLLD